MRTLKSVIRRRLFQLLKVRVKYRLMAVGANGSKASATRKIRLNTGRFNAIVVRAAMKLSATDEPCSLALAITSPPKSVS